MPLLITDHQQLLEHLRLRAENEQPHRLVGELLVDGGHLDPQNLQQALRLQGQKPDLGRIGDILLRRKLIDQQHLAEALVQQLDSARVDLEVFRVEPRALLLLPEHLAREYQVLPLMLEGELLVVAAPTPSDSELLHLLGFVSGKRVEAIYVSSEEVQAAINLHYGVATELELPEQQGREPELSLHRIQQLAEDKPTVRFVDSLLEDAIGRHASDIHLRPGEREVVVLFRIDGVLTEIRRIRPGNLPAIVSRIKIIGGMNIAERRLPQDGRHLVRLGDRTIDLRLSIMPTVYGESVVIRILDTRQSLKTLDQIGFNSEDARRFRNLTSHNQGILLVTGPTGSGKSTTLYAALNGIKTTGVNIITVEDPVEYQIDGIRQIQVKPQIGYTFARALRHILRHDPDVIMVGEIRDQETAIMATESALTGHLVLSTLHTNSAATTVTRLLEIGVAPYLLNASLLGVLAQRLVRRNCPQCLEEEQVPDYVRTALGLDAQETFYVGRGCSHCHGKGFAGRVAAYELLEVTPALRALIQPAVAAQAIEAQAIADGMRPLTQSALALARDKLIALAEVYRVRLE
ncbi:MAG: GspE/PulE family protein [Pseudomonas sp.]|uniref:GspE/PulE family protein n=1 Tax=Pseudomonas sp. TaxID=306 RepID=UPI00299CE0B8|nr:GspE/PulE family protein [Pseudomonas sp.]MDX1724991.1 GspE/PulE family protein [Pseudomonas sp.]